MMLRVLALVVVYGCRPSETPSVRSLTQSAKDGCEVKMLVWDNSPVRQEDDLSTHGIEADYVFTPENLGLSTIYNRVIRERLKDGEYLLLLDQDTQLPPDFLTRSAAAVESQPDVDLFLPMVRANGRWASPLSYACGWGRDWKSPRHGSMPSRRVCAINSGMLISSTYLLRSFPGYDERLRFYGTDTQFMLDYMDRRAVLYVLNTTLTHDLSFFSDTPSDRASKFVSMKSAYRFIYGNRPIWQRMTVVAVMLLVSIRYAIKYRDPAFLRANAP